MTGTALTVNALEQNVIINVQRNKKSANIRDFNFQRTLKSKQREMNLLKCYCVFHKKVNLKEHYRRSVIICPWQHQNVGRVAQSV